MRISLWVLGFGDGEVFEASSLHRLFWGVADHVQCAEPPDLQLSAEDWASLGHRGDSIIQLILTYWHHHGMLLYQLCSTSQRAGRSNVEAQQGGLMKVCANLLPLPEFKAQAQRPPYPSISSINAMNGMETSTEAHQSCRCRPDVEPSQEAEAAPKRSLGHCAKLR